MKSNTSRFAIPLTLVKGVVNSPLSDPLFSLQSPSSARRGGGGIY